MKKESIKNWALGRKCILRSEESGINKPEYGLDSIILTISSQLIVKNLRENGERWEKSRAILKSLESERQYRSFDLKTLTRSFYGN